jgi:2-dehydro-3-deoxygluconokinase
MPYDGVGRTRNGLCFIEVGIGPRASRMLYDRGHSAISGIRPGEIDWENLMSQSGWFHTTGISTALSESVADEVIAALKAAKKHGVKTSFDLNFRSTLWSAERAKEVIKQVMPYIDVIIGNEEDFEKCLGITAEGTTQNYSNINPLGYETVARKVIKEYPNVELVGTTLRDAKTALLNDWQTAMLYKGKYYLSRKYENLEIMDRIGGGDSFASALIYCCIAGKEAQEMIDFSAAYSALCHGFMGDWNWATKEEAENVMKGGSARIKR